MTSRTSRLPQSERGAAMIEYVTLLGMLMLCFAMSGITSTGESVRLRFESIAGQIESAGGGTIINDE